METFIVNRVAFCSLMIVVGLVGVVVCSRIGSGILEFFMVRKDAVGSKHYRQLVKLKANPGQLSRREMSGKCILATGGSGILGSHHSSQRRPDITQAGCLLGWSPKVLLHEGLESTIAYFDQLSSGPKIGRTQPAAVVEARTL